MYLAPVGESVRTGFRSAALLADAAGDLFLPLCEKGIPTAPGILFLSSGRHPRTQPLAPRSALFIQPQKRDSSKISFPESEDRRRGSESPRSQAPLRVQRQSPPVHRSVVDPRQARAVASRSKNHCVSTFLCRLPSASPLPFERWDFLSTGSFDRLAALAHVTPGYAPATSNAAAMRNCEETHRTAHEVPRKCKTLSSWRGLRPGRWQNYV